jgi:hypothetical protein
VGTEATLTRRRVGERKGSRTRGDAGIDEDAHGHHGGRASGTRTSAPFQSCSSSAKNTTRKSRPWRTGGSIPLRGDANGGAYGRLGWGNSSENLSQSNGSFVNRGRRLAVDKKKEDEREKNKDIAVKLRSTLAGRGRSEAAKNGELRAGVAEVFLNFLPALSTLFRGEDGTAAA